MPFVRFPWPRFVPAILVVTAAAMLASCTTRDASTPPKAGRPNAAATKAPAATRPAASSGGFVEVGKPALLPNAHYVTAKVIAGAQPEGDAAFRALRDLGVRTIVTVDGAKPDVEAAQRYGLRYVHLPITYSGVKPEEGKAIAKALDELPGLIYVHCHHGKHRSAAAVAVACVYNGTLPPARAESVLQTFGTGENYTGLWRAAREARPLPPGELRDFKVEFVPARQIPPLADAMVGVDERWDHMKAIQKAGWRAPADHPDLDPPHEALQLEEVFHELGRNDRSHADKPDFARLLAEAEAGTKALRAAVAVTPADAPAANAAFKRVSNTCATCHKAYRD